MEVVGLVAASLEISRTVLEVREKFKAFRDAPQEVTALLDDVSRLSSLLTAISKQCDIYAPYMHPSPEWTCVYEFCKSCCDDLQELGNQLNASIQKGRFGGSLKTVLKGNAILMHRQKLESAKSRFLLAQTSLNSALSARQILQTINTQKLLTNVLRQTPDVQASMVVATGPANKDCLHKQKDDNGPISKSSHQERSNRNERFRFVSPTRLLGWVFEVRAWKGSNTWTIDVCTWNVRPRTSQIFLYAQQNNVAGLRSLLATKEASIVDVDPEGRTALMYAVRSCNVETAKFLIDQGSDINWKDQTFQITCLSELLDSQIHILSLEGNASAKRQSELLALASPLIEIDPDNLITYDEYRYSLIFCQFIFSFGKAMATTCEMRYEVEKLALNKIWPPYNHLDLEKRLHYACSNSFFITPAQFWTQLGQKYFDHHIGTLDNVYIVIAKALGYLYSKDFKAHPCKEQYFTGWRDILRQALNLSGNITTHDSLMFEFLEAALRSVNLRFGKSHHQFTLWIVDTLRCQHVSKLANDWIGELLAVGLPVTQLDAYIAHEQALLRGMADIGPKPDFVSSHRRRYFKEAAKVRIIGLDKDKNSNNVTVWTSWPFDETAGDFWSMVEEREEYLERRREAMIRVPGGWQGDDEEIIWRWEKDCG